ncbi:MAG: hypothetical protein ACRDFA_09290 [bacterium]
MSRPVPSKDELMTLMEAKVTEARASLRAAAESLALSAEQQKEYEKLITALDDLERKIQSLKES